LDLDRAFPELVRVLKSNGFLVGIETFGHNPLTNFKRKINKLIGKKTAWAASHIFQMKDLEKAKNILIKSRFIFFI
jgi:ubiquinone/menaquinone biosynthesis C-methylase UbiE